ncbi:glycoside hydrolase family 25 protein [Tahibacter amnicola]|uniref:Glycoside hydrolase family 25 protein n=1 Tax=Tahibacter amnicola TaxID=2976241 RepID=A0ABY6BE02_9GAMM|nr:glycoside hydrolase family 25 protein [Tahibacter amnicola]UXI66851.1 glycoside hydrolase family 25 protein [Tahibacter amnicola]
MLNVVIDLSHHNATVDFAQIAASGIRAVFHKATQGTGYTDPTYAPRKPLALEAGLLWGAYHFGDGSDAITQATHFLNVVKPGPNDLLVLDIEQNTSGTSMTLAQAEQFVTQLFKATGRWPGVYGGSYLKNLLQGNGSSVLGNCWLWWAEYAAAPKIAPLWPEWTLWQYTDGYSGPTPHTVTGVGNCDRDQFVGDEAALLRLWGASGTVAPVVLGTTV